MNKIFRMDFDKFNISKTFRCKELCLNNSNKHYQINEVPFCELMDTAELVLNAIPKREINANQVIGIAAKKSSLLIAGIIGIIKSGNAFAIFEPASVEYHRKQFERFRIDLAFFEKTNNFEECSEDFRDIGPFYVAKFRNNGYENNFKQKILYAIQTSGSTGEPKICHVPFSAILPNLHDFKVHFSIDNSSSIFFGTSTNFDPSLVELLLAMFAGAELIIPKFNWNGTIFENILERERITFLQITPAVLKCFPSMVLRKLFGPESNVDFLLIGGENFPLNLIKQFLNELTKTRIFNVYGITEVSCWASYFEIDHKIIGKLENGRVPIGKPILNTKFEISKEDGILLIHGRKCIINFKFDENGPTSTGDIASFGNEQLEIGGKNDPMIYVESRLKPNSQLPSIALENEIMNLFPQIITAKLLFIGNCRFLFLDYFDGKSTISDLVIKQKIPKSSWPTRIFWNFLHNSANFITQNGKINESELRKYVHSKYDDESILLPNFMHQNYGIPIFDQNALSTNSFRHFGIGSIEAAEIAFFLTNSKNKSKFEWAEIMQFILDDQNTMEQFFEKFGGMEKYEPAKNILFVDGKQINLMQNDGHNFVVEERWRNCLGKCIDGTPVHSIGLIFAASHSGILKCISLQSGKVLFEYFAENDRFEAGAAVKDNLVAIGGFSGKMFIFDIQNGGNKPKCTIQCASEIRMVPIFDGEDQIYWGDYSGNIWQLQISTMTANLINSLNFGFLRSSPLLSNSNLIFGTLDGIFVSLGKNNGQILWKHKMDSPIFASPIRCEQNINCIGLSVKGELNLINLTDGKLVDSLNLSSFGSSFFDSPICINVNLFLIPAGKSHLLLIGFVPKLTFLKQICLPESASILRTPILFQGNLFVLNIEGTLFTFPIAILFDEENKIQPFANVLLKLEAKTFGHPLILKEEVNEGGAGGNFSITIGTRADFLHCFSVKCEQKLH